MRLTIYQIIQYLGHVSMSGMTFYVICYLECHKECDFFSSTSFNMCQSYKERDQALEINTKSHLIDSDLQLPAVTI